MKQYLDLLRKILVEGDGHNDRTGVGTISLFGPQVEYDLQAGFPLMTTKRMAVRAVFEELFWFLSGDTYEPRLRRRGLPGKPIKIWEEWATPEQCARFRRQPGDLGPIYGHAWRNFGATLDYAVGTSRFDLEKMRYQTPRFLNNGTDQIKRILTQLQEEPRSRRIIVSAWHPEDAEEVALPPCHTLFQLKWHEGTDTLDLKLYQRSADVFLGVPFNIASYALLLVVLAKLNGMKPGKFIHTFGDVHIYKNHLRQVEEQLQREPRPMPRLEVKVPSGLSVDEQLRYLATEIKFDDFSLEGYDPYPSISAPVAV